ncbi:MAG: Type I restriction modification DNA specificity domain protein [Candidatus Accumulibacter appositus]|uniref:Type I restriction modification DNA specificity domain protein n=1 Tax=Candidatus Accumulibacter appositus TaxID=1454003 RepID=A0A011QEG0_9PROT|nr:MAG: Type I restriction modification DNA specificity domain protein [Candidatus Accumulibacter appositus]
MSFPRYPSYKDSGVEWLGEVPVGWEVKKLKREIKRCVSGGGLIKGEMSSESAEGLFQGFSASGADVWVNEAHYREPGIVLSAVGARCGKAFKADGQWAAVANTHVFLPKHSEARNFLWYLMNDESFWEKGGSAQPYIRVPVTLGKSLAFPTLSEQTAIADFLGRETAKIDELVAEQRRLVELLKEKRQAVISHAVTKGLNPETPMKPSGIEWLGEVPAHWEIRKLSQLFRAGKGKNGQMLTKEFCAENEGEYPVYSGQTENEGVMGTWNQFEFDFAESGVLFSTTVGAKAMYLRQLFGRFSLSQNCMIIWPTMSGCQTRFFYYHFQPLFQFHRALIPEHMQASFRIEDLYGYRIAVPPTDEQYAMVAFLDMELAKFDTLTTEAQRAIDLLQERRTALISAAVTGQIDVRALSPTQAMEAAA